MTEASEKKLCPLVVWFEIAVLDLERAQAFYKAVLGAQFKEEPSPSGEHTLAIFVGIDCSAGGGALIKGPHYTPSADGATIYFYAGPDLAEALARVEPAGGKVVLPKMSIGPYGFIAHFMDTEGNRVALHSMA